MFRPSTLLVVGAGASCDAGLPLGEELIKFIASALKFRQVENVYHAGNGNGEIYRTIVNYGGSDKATALVKLCTEISSSLVDADSIDSYLNDYAKDDDRIFCGKIAIARTIAEAESNSLLKIDKSHTSNSLNWEALADKWYPKFFRILKAGISRDNIDHIFDNVRIICFNYDRCIEQYLYYALRNYYQITPQESVDLLKKLKIIHTYGTIGGFSIDPNTGFSNYGSVLQGIELIERAKTVKTVYDNIEDIHKLEDIKSEILRAEQAIFLGFGFLDLNVEMLKSRKQNRNLKAVYATGYKIPDPVEGVIRNHISSIFSGDKSEGLSDFANTILRRDCTSRMLLDEYSLLMAN
jgi:hypothetical protein